MAAKCYSCDDKVMNNEFINCAGICGGIFHTKCASITKAMLNAVNNCPNIHWYCNDCNDGNRHISTAIKNIDDSVERLTKSLSGDLLNFLDGLRTLMDKILGKVVTMGCTSSHSVISRDVVADQPTDKIHFEVPICRSNVAGQKVDSLPHDMTDKTSTKSIVVSNIASDVSVDCLTNYLCTKLGIKQTSVHLSLLLPAGRTPGDMRFLQYKVTVPSDNYGSIMSPELWPNDVRLRDFIFKGRNCAGVVSKESFSC